MDTSEIKNLIGDPKGITTGQLNANLPKILHALTDMASSGAGQSDWNENDPSKPDYIKNKPTIPAAQIQSDWNQNNNTKKDFIKNKPNVITQPATPGEAGQVLALDSEGNPEWVNAAKGGTYDAELDPDSTNAPQSKAVVDYVSNNYAQKSGHYSSLISGAAENLIGRGSVPAEFLRRTSGGTADIGSGSATLTSIKGNSIVWNQLMNLASHSYEVAGLTVSWTNGKYTISGTASSGGGTTLIPRITTITAHKYFLHLNGTQNFNSFTWREVSLASMQSRIFTESTGAANTSIVINTTAGNEYNASFEFFVIDLTLMFGAGNEPSTVGEFEALFPLPYYAQNAGTLINNAATGMVTDGFNQWDEVAESGDINANTGMDQDDNTKIRSVNYIRVFGGTPYYIKTSGLNCRMRFYDAGKNYIGYSGQVVAEGEFTPPSNAVYMRIVLYEATYTQGQCCVNLSWSGYRNGEYEPYWSDITALPITTATGKLNGEGESVVVFPNGMAGDDTVFDYCNADTDGLIRKVTRRFYGLDLANLSWNYASSARVFYAVESNIAVNTLRIINPFGWTPVNTDAALAAADYAIKKDANGTIIIKDASVDSIAAFLEKVSGNPIYGYSGTAVYVLDTPVPVAYQVDDFGTETIIPEGVDENGVPYTAPFKADIKYALNAVDTLRRLPETYIKKESMENILNALKTAGIIADFTLSYDSEDQEYDCTVTAPSNE